jgi:hypothetical protein
MVSGSIALPGAIIMVNDTITSVNQNRLVINLHIDEVMTGNEFDLRINADSNYARTVKAHRKRLLILRDHRDTTNRALMDIVGFVKYDMLSITQNCFGPPGGTYKIINLHWGQLCIFNTEPDGTCLENCSTCCSSCTPCCFCDGYSGTAPYYPATYNPMYPQENHSYNQVDTNIAPFGCSCSDSCDHTLCRIYYCDSEGCIPGIDCRLIKA